MEDPIIKKYSSYRLNELQQVLRDIDRDKYPERVIKNVFTNQREDM